jgi:hypothetical protein
MSLMAIARNLKPQGPDKASLHAQTAHRRIAYQVLDGPVCLTQPR